MTSKWAKGTGGPAGDECQNLVVEVVAFSAGNSAKARGIGLQVDQSPTLRGAASGTNQTPTIAVWTKAKRAQSVDDDETWVWGEVAPTLNAFDQGDTRATVLAFGHTQGIDIQASEEASPTLRRNGGGAGVQIAAAVRRLTPVECERLMGWPDNHTAVGATDNGDIVQLADSPRYRMIGNGVASPVAAWIGRHLLAVDGAE